MRRGEGEFEASGGPGGEPCPGFFRYVRGMIVEDQLDRSPGRIGGVEELEEFDELAAAMAVFDESMDLPVSRSMPANRLSVPWRLYS